MQIVWFGKPGIPEAVLTRRVKFKGIEDIQYFDEDNTMVSGVITTTDGQELRECISSLRLAAAVDHSMRGEIHPSEVKSYASQAFILCRPYEKRYLSSWEENYKETHYSLFPETDKTISA